MPDPRCHSKQDILWLDITMNNALAVDVLHGNHDLMNYDTNLGLGEPFSSEYQREQVAPRGKFEKDIPMFLLVVLLVPVFHRRQVDTRPTRQYES